MAPETFSYIGYAIAEESRAGIAQKLREVEELLAALKLNVAYMPQTTIAGTVFFSLFTYRMLP